MKILNKQELYDILSGAEILGCGGGGELEWGKVLIDEAIAGGKKFKLISPEELDDNSLVSIAGFVGGGVSEKIKMKLAHLEEKLSPQDKFQKPLLKACEELSIFLNKEIDAFLPTETGAGNFAAPFYVSAMLDKYIIDGDACGRAKPEIAISTTHIKGLSITPLALVSPFGDVVILKETCDDYRAEDICRINAVISGGTCALARCPAKGKDYRGAFIPGTITACLKLGQAVREANEKRENPAGAFLETIKKARPLFRGKVKKWTREKKEGFMWGDIGLEGIGRFEGKNMHIWYKNEFLLARLEEKPFITSPDLICVVETETGKGLSNWIEDLSVYLGRDVSVMGIEAEEIWKSPKGLEIFGHGHFGFNIEYKNFIVSL